MKSVKSLASSNDQRGYVIWVRKKSWYYFSFPLAWSCTHFSLLFWYSHGALAYQQWKARRNHCTTPTICATQNVKMISIRARYEKNYAAKVTRTLRIVLWNVIAIGLSVRGHDVVYTLGASRGVAYNYLNVPTTHCQLPDSKVAFFACKTKTSANQRALWGYSRPKSSLMMHFHFVWKIFFPQNKKKCVFGWIA